MLNSLTTQAALAALATSAIATSSIAGISTYIDDVSRIQDPTNHANFNGLVDEQTLENYTEDGLLLNVNRSYFSWDAPGLDGSEMYYASTGSLGLIDISLVSGDDFDDVDMQLASGWVQDEIDTMYLWVQLYDNGGLVEELNIDMMAGDYLAMTGGGFDQIRIGSYATEEIRDSRNPIARNAIAIDNVSVGTYVPVPAPGTLAISSIALIGLRRRR
ncbi:MAG: PEP-CTERM sorting domain-containing protein [Phycisphaerales bacterium]|nr:PEP-CTERM sorting domain-containing protein [Phycisphaerales bacterium]